MATSIHSIGPVIKEHRIGRNWSQEDLARMIGVRGLAVGKWERGQATPSHENRLALARVFGVSAEIFGYDAPTPLAADEPPAWFQAYIQDQQRRHEETHAALALILNAIRAR